MSMHHKALCLNPAWQPVRKKNKKKKTSISHSLGGENLKWYTITSEFISAWLWLIDLFRWKSPRICQVDLLFWTDQWVNGISNWVWLMRLGMQEGLFDFSEPSEGRPDKNVDDCGFWDLLSPPFFNLHLQEKRKTDAVQLYKSGGDSRWVLYL